MSNLANLKNVNFLKNADRIRYGIDYLRLNFTQPITFFTRKMSCLVANSDTIVEDWRTYTKIPLSSWLCVIVTYSYNGVAVPIMLYNVFWWNKIYKKFARLDFYWSFFRLIESWEFEKDYFFTYVQNLTDENPTISRIDYCYDLFYNEKTKIPTPKKLLKEINDSSKIYEIKKGYWLESWSVGSKTNKRYIVRMYDKLLDTSKKWKFFLYGDYLQYQSVHRFEVEFWPKFTRWYQLSQIWQLISKIQSFLGINNQTFDGLMFYKYTSKFELNEYNQTRFFKQYISKVKKIYDAWLNPYMVAYNWLLVHCQTKYDQELHKDLIKEVLTKSKIS